MYYKPLLITLLLVIGFCVGIAFATTFSFTYDTATPAGSDDPAEADDRMREIKAAVQERQNVDHYWPLTGTEVSDTDAGEHRKILFHAPIASTPTVAEDHGDLRIKDVNSKAELTWTDEDENELILTSKGNNLANDTFLTATDNAGTGSVNLIKADINDVAVLPENTILTPGVTPDANDEIVNKKYVDDSLHSFGVWNDRDQDGSADTVVTDTQYTAATDGIVVMFASGTSVKKIETPVGTQRVVHDGQAAGDDYSLTCPVRKGDTWKAFNAATVFWLPIGQ